MESATPQSWLAYVCAVLLAALGWVVRGYAADVKAIKGNYMTRDEVATAIAAAQKATTDALATHQTSTATSFAELRAAADNRGQETTANFRELRTRLDSTNDTLLKIALQLKP